MDFKNKNQDELKAYKALIKTKFGNIKLEFFPDIAPNHVKNFLGLASEKFYDGTTFHRVIPGFMIQGGCPNSKKPNSPMVGMGNPGYAIDAEFSEKPHKRGILSMARSSDPNSAGSQFFIVHKDAPHLNGSYSVFGQVEEGIDVVDKIAEVETNREDKPINPIKMEIEIIQA